MPVLAGFVVSSNCDMRPGNPRGFDKAGLAGGVNGSRGRAGPAASLAAGRGGVLTVAGRSKPQPMFGGN
jgi:hypothetical protein